MKYIHYFGTEAAYNQERNNNYIEPWISYTEGKGIDYNKSEEVYFKMPFTVEILESGEISWNLGELTVEYSKNSGPWTTMDSETSISVVQGDEVAFMGINNMYSYIDSDEGEYMPYSFRCSARFNAKGNIMSLTDGDNFERATSVDDYAFYKLFWSNTEEDEDPVPIVSAEHLILPVRSISTGCYDSMFMSCTYLLYPPKLPATVLYNYCYQCMFQGCSSLLAAPKLPATALADSCYAFMFYDCVSLERAPRLLATTLENSCYSYMFSGCTSLSEAPNLPATSLAQSCYSSMFSGCTSLTSAPELPATSLAQSCYANMFSGCTGLTEAPELSATSLAQACYQGMFFGCTSLTSAPELPATTLATYCYSGMFSGCSNLTTAPELPAITLLSNCYKNMFFNCSALNYIKAMFTTKPSRTYTDNWVFGVASTGTFVKNSAATWTTTGTNAIPTGWTVQTVSA